MGLRLGVEKTRLVCQQWHGAVDGHTVQLQVQHRCTDCGLWTQIRSNCWIRGLTANRFFLFRGRDVAITMNSVKILHAVRSAITAIAELLVCLFRPYSMSKIWNQFWFPVSLLLSNAQIRHASVSMVIEYKQTRCPIRWMYFYYQIQR